MLKYAVIGGASIAYLLFFLWTGIGIPCPFYELTGLKCPGCGISRMFISLAKLDFAAAFGHNPFLLITGPFLIAYLAYSEVGYVLYGNRRMGKREIFLWAELGLAIAYGILRNIFPI